MCAGKVTLSLLAGGLFSQIVCMIFSAIEMKLSEKASMNSTEEFYIGLQTLSLIDDVQRLRYTFHMLRYTGAIFHVFAVCALLYVFCNREQYQGVKGLLVASGCTGLLQIFGLVAQGVRLGVLLVYTIKHACDSDTVNVEPNYDMLGKATVFGTISVLLHVVYVFACMYDKNYRYDQKVRANNNLAKDVNC